ncbi:MAG: antibiotic biosynthesis monooxygenase [Streptosporangiaceae bacterium]|nr:antibiotic biosynthesis monooxygenase [Streptosporangiaceae bacterium]
MSEPVVLINLFEVPAADAEQFIAEWEKARDYLETQPGYVDTVLHQALAPEAGFQFVNVARWSSPEEFAAAIRSPGFQQTSAGMARYGAHPALYRVVRT